jgi:thymidylate synthase
MDNDLNTAWLRMLGEIIYQGDRVSPRGLDTSEVLGHQLVVDMARPVLSIRTRKLGYRFMAAEAAWTLSGDNRVSTIAPYSKTIAAFSDDGLTFFGAYGPKLHAQLTSVVTALKEDPGTRRAVANIWRENPMRTKDYPCHLSCQFLIRDARLHCFATMRSSDAWLGVPYDVSTFSHWAAYVLLALGDKTLSLGRLCNTAASRHLYHKDLPGALRCLEDDEAFLYQYLDPWEFKDHEELVDHLWRVAMRDSDPAIAWLKELP